VYPDDKAMPGGAGGSPSFRSFRAINSMVLKDGQTAQFTTATDKVTGETVRIDVTLTVRLTCPPEPWRRWKPSRYAES
jgi:hypothetical protein